jgi:chemosensory pili system protein ChpB (putative protein-glutamate methylesterase)
MLDTNDSRTRVAILAASEQHQHHLSSLLEEAGLNVVVHETAGEGFLNKLEQSPADVLLVDLAEDTDSEIEIIDTLLEQNSLPIFFNDSSAAGSGTNALWAKKLARKLAQLVDTHEPEAELQPSAEPALLEPAIPAVSDTQTQTAEIPDVDNSSPATNIWVLGASLGGPQAVRQFLSSIKPDLPVAFLLAQHIGANHIALLAEQLDRVSPFKVTAGRNGQALRHHEVILAPADKQLHITEDGYLSLSPQAADAIYSPCINEVITAVASRYKQQAGTIIFSGMGDDGALGCQAMAENGGVVWAQDVDSCVISSMPDQARKTHTVTFSADPRALADHLYQYYSDGVASFGG